MSSFLEVTPDRIRLIHALERAMIHEPETLRDKTYLSTRSGPVVAAYLAWKNGSAQPGTLDTYEHTLSRLCHAFPGHAPGDFTTSEILAVIESWPAKSRRTKARAPIRDFFKFAVAWERLHYNPCDLLPDLKQPQPKVYDIFSQAEQQRILTAAGHSLLPQRDRATCWLFLDTGARRNDIRLLQWENVNLEERVVQYMHRKGGKQQIVEYGAECWSALIDAWSTPYAKPPRGETEVRTPRHEDYVLYPNGASGGIYQTGRWVTWVNPTMPMQESTIWRWWKRTLDAAGVKHRKLHMTRHTHGTEVYEATGDIYQVKDRLGHSSTTVSEIYVHQSKQRGHAAVTAVEAYRKAIREQQASAQNPPEGD